MKAPKFSIIIPALNEEKFLPNLLDSLSNQTFANFEVIVVDGKSKDSTVLVAKSYTGKVPALTTLISEKRSLPAQRNLGASKATGEWLIFVDADSVLLPYCLTQIDAYISRENPKFFTSWCTPDSNDMGDALIVLFWNLVLESLIRFKRQLSPGPLTVIRKDVFSDIGGYDLTHDFNEDVDLSLRLYTHGISLTMLRETVYVVSLRRLRAQGKLKVAQQYVQASLPVLFFSKSLSKMPGYIMGGHLYDKKKKPLKALELKSINKKLQAILKDLFR
jgi:hypothetical protein